jgi:hypothetical protein
MTPDRHVVCFVDGNVARIHGSEHGYVDIHHLYLFRFQI